jgi:putative endonuclease
VNFAFITRSLPKRPWPRPRRDPREALGARGERAAARFLRRRGFRILARNYDCPLGEIDIIAADGASIVFIEVKSRSSFDTVDPGEAARPVQWARIDRSARYFLRRHQVSDRPCRFDLVTIEWGRRWRGWRPQIEHVENAFIPPTGRGTHA